MLVWSKTSVYLLDSVSMTTRTACQGSQEQEVLRALLNDNAAESALSLHICHICGLSREEEKLISSRFGWVPQQVSHTTLKYTQFPMHV